MSNRIAANVEELKKAPEGFDNLGRGADEVANKIEGACSAIEAGSEQSDEASLAFRYGIEGSPGFVEMMTALREQVRGITTICSTGEVNLSDETHNIVTALEAVEAINTTNIGRR